MNELRDKVFLNSKEKGFWDKERNMDEFTFGINDGDMFIEKAYKIFLTNDDFVLKSSEEAYKKSSISNFKQ